MDEIYLNVGLRFVTKTFEDENGKIFEYERLEIFFPQDGVIITAKVDKGDLKLLKFILEGKEEEFNE